jgi:hypothetical protein
VQVVPAYALNALVPFPRANPVNVPTPVPPRVTATVPLETFEPLSAVMPEPAPARFVAVSVEVPLLKVIAASPANDPALLY